jgi:uncharacterized phage protein gp47/JayE
MYENVTFETIMERALAKVPSFMDKREGSVIWDAIAPAAVELQNMYIQLDVILKETFADTASLYYLKKRAAERGIYQIMATKAVLQGVFTPAELEIPIGSRFNCDKLNYIITEKISDGAYKMQCETAGTEGNRHLGMLIPIDYIDGMETANLTELLIPAEDDEDVESLRKRYLNSLASQAYGGNIADYVEKVNAIQGVGGVKVTPVWNGGGTVKITFIDSTFHVPSEEMVEMVKNEADPYPYEGLGYGFAPIGHVVTVEGVEGVTVNIVTNITYREGWNWTSAKPYILNAIDQYFNEISAEWEDSKKLFVRISQLESRILDCEAVLDIEGTKLNGVASNVLLEGNQIPVRGTVNGE